MPEISYEDMLVGHGDVLKITWKGSDPFGKFYKNIEVIVRQSLEIDSPKWLPKKISWDDHGSFYGKWEARKPGDRWTKMKLTIVCFGHQSTADAHKEGEITIKLKGTIATSYEWSHNLQKSLWWAYNFLFYKHIRSKLFFEYQDAFYEIEDKIRALYGMRRKRNPELAQYA